MFKISKKAVVLSVLAVLVVLISIFLLNRRKVVQEYVPPVPVITVAKPVSGNLCESIVISGYVEANAMIPVVPFVSGTIKAYNYKAGDFVQKDTVLAKIDDAPYKQQFLQAQAAFYGYESTFTRIENLYKSGATTQQNYDSAKAQYDAAKAQYDLAKLQMEYTEVKAPVTGTILVADSAEGSIGATTQPLFVMADMNNLVVRLKVPEKYFDLFITRKDQIKMNVTRPGVKNMYEDAVTTATIENIAPYVSAESKNFQVVCRLDNPGERFRPGMYIKVATIYAEHQNVSLMPVNVRKLDGSFYIYNEEDNTVKFVEMKDAVSDGNNFLVPEEYSNAWFVTDGQNSVFDGQTVRVLWE